MDTQSIIGMVFLFAGIIISRIINERAMKKLTADEKVKLIDGFSGLRLYSIIPIVVVIGLFVVLNRYSTLSSITVFVIYISLLLFIVFALQMVVHKKLLSLEFPKSYLKMYHISRVFYLTGFGGFLATLFVK